MLKSLMDVLVSKNEGIIKAWVRKVRDSPNLVTYNCLSDDELQNLNYDMYKKLSQWIEREVDKNALGSFFVDLGKRRRIAGFPVSEVTYAMLLAQRSVIEYLTNESVVDNAMALYQVLNVTKQVADFFFLGSYYMMKGYLEDIYVALNRDQILPDDIIKKYLADDFFFK